jgi:hypothetical protein
MRFELQDESEPITDRSDGVAGSTIVSIGLPARVVFDAVFDEGGAVVDALPWFRPIE